LKARRELGSDAQEIGNSRDDSARLDNDEKGVDIIDAPGGKQDLRYQRERPVQRHPAVL